MSWRNTDSGGKWSCSISYSFMLWQLLLRWSLQWREEKKNPFCSYLFLVRVVMHRDDEHIFNYFLRKPHHSSPLSLQKHALRNDTLLIHKVMNYISFKISLYFMLEIADSSLGVIETGGAYIKRSWLLSRCLADLVDLLQFWPWFAQRCLCTHDQLSCIIKLVMWQLTFFFLFKGMKRKICFYWLISLVIGGLENEIGCKGREPWRKQSKIGCKETLSCNSMTKYHLILIFGGI